MKPGQQGDPDEQQRSTGRSPRQRRANRDAAAPGEGSASVGVGAVNTLAAAVHAAHRRLVKAAEVLMVLMFSAFGAHAQAETLEQVTTKAMTGDYQAQRNLAYGYSSYPYKGQDKNPLLACAWRRVILMSGNTRIDQTDVNNAEVECGKLDRTQQANALTQARTIFLRVYGRDPK